MFFLNHFSALTKSTPLFQLWQLVLHAGASVFPVEVVSPVDTTSTFSTPLLLHTDTTICWHSGTTVDWYTGSPLDTADPSKLTRLTQDGRTETNLDLFAATPHCSVETTPQCCFCSTLFERQWFLETRVVPSELGAYINRSQLGRNQPLGERNQLHLSASLICCMLLM